MVCPGLSKEMSYISNISSPLKGIAQTNAQIALITPDETVIWALCNAGNTLK
jgi:hypothetical protein